MTDDVLINKAASIERGVKRAREEYERAPATFATDLSRQDAAILNILRACEAALDMGQHLIERELRRAPQNIDEHARAPGRTRSVHSSGSHAGAWEPSKLLSAVNYGKE